jgi:hypothetical protein
MPVRKLLLFTNPFVVPEVVDPAEANRTLDPVPVTANESPSRIVAPDDAAGMFMLTTTDAGEVLDSLDQPYTL